MVGLRTFKSSFKIFCLKVICFVCQPELNCEINKSGGKTGVPPKIWGGMAHLGSLLESPLRLPTTERQNRPTLSDSEETVRKRLQRFVNYKIYLHHLHKNMLQQLATNWEIVSCFVIKNKN